MPRGKKRIDAQDTNILSDPQYDQILNADSSKKYWGCADEDMPTAIGRGYKRVERSDDPSAPRPAKWWDGQADQGAGFRINNQLTWMEIDKDRADKIQAASEERHNRVMRATAARIKDPSQDDTRYLSYTRDPGFRNRLAVSQSEEAR